MYSEYDDKVNTKFINTTKEYCDPDTGEKIQVTEVHKKIYGSKLFYKVWLSDLLEALGLISNSRQLDVLFYILDNANADNVFIGTNRSIAEATDASTKTVNRVIRKALDADLMRMQQRGVYLINPKLLMRGGEGKKQRLLIEYEKVKDDNQIDGQMALTDYDEAV